MRPIASMILMGLFLLSPRAIALEETVPQTHAAIANAIQVYYESRFDELKPVYQGHWVLRLYRISGDARYLEELSDYGDFLSKQFLLYVEGLGDPVLRALKTEELLGPVPKSNMGKAGKRRQVLAQATDYLYMHQLLFLTFLTQSIGLDDGNHEAYQTALAALRGFSFQPYFMDKNLLLNFAAEVSNDVYFLKKLGLGDFEDEFLRFFKETYRLAGEDVDKVIFENKIYGMTHLMIADSEYYQKKVSRKKFRWILDYFDKNVDVILARLKPDVAAEVGLCFLLAGLPDHSVVAKTRRFVAGAWDPASGMIPSVLGHTDLNHGEHRNVLAIMLLKGFTQLYPGPDLSMRAASS